VRRVAFSVVAVAAAALTATAAAATSGTRVTSVDLQSYPNVVVNAVTPFPTKRPPRLLENGLPALGVDAVNLGSGKSMVVAIDNSRSMMGSPLSSAAAAARQFIDSKSRGDKVAVFSFGRHALQLTGFSTSAGQADSALGGLAVDAASGTALYDAVVAGARSLRSSAGNGRVIVVLTDGRDVSSLATLDQAVAAAHRANAAVYTIGIEGTDFEPGALRSLSRATGGTYHSAGSAAELQQVYAALSSELERTWRLTYATAARPGEVIDLRLATAGAGAAHASVEVPTAFGGAPQTPPSSLLPGRAYNPIGTLAISLLAGLLLLTAIVSLVRPRGSWVQRRLAAHVDQTRGRERSSDRLAFLKVLFKATEGALGRRSEWRSLERMLVRGDVPLRAAEFIWLMGGCGLAMLALLALFGAPLLVALVGSLVAGGAPYAVVAFRVRRRAKAFEDQLPDILTTIAASLKAGHSFRHGLQAVVEEAQPPASIELKRVLTEAGLGRPLDDALSDMAARVGSENFAFAITAVTIQRQVGGSMASLFDMVSDSVRNRQQFARKIRSLTAMGRMSAYTLMGVPFFIGGMVSLMNPNYMAPLFHTHTGHILVFLGVTMMAVGSLLLQKIVSFKG